MAKLKTELKMKKYILALVATIVVVSCSDYKYPENKVISERNGARIDSTISYLPDTIKFSGIEHTFEWNIERRGAIDCYYDFTSEALLYNYYQGRRIFRFLFEKEGKAPIIVSINQEGGRTWMISKIIYEKEEIAPACGIMLVRAFDNHTKDLTESQVKGFESLLANLDFFHLQTEDSKTAFANYCLIEGHEDGKYWLVYRSLDDVELKPLVEYIENLSRFKYDTDKVTKLPLMSMP